MTLAADCGWAAVRCAGVAAAAVVAGWGVRALLDGSSRRVARAVWLAHLVPYLTPVVLVGYGYSFSRFSLSLIRYPVWNQAFYTALVWLKLVPVATLVLTFAPSALSPEAAWCHRLLRGSGRVSAASSLAFWLRGAGRTAGVAFAAVFLLAFGEFEMASLLGVERWTVRLFDAQVGGLALGASLRLVAPALVCELAVLGLALALVWPRDGATPTRPRGRRAGRWARLAAWAELAAALLVVTVVPLAIVLRGAFRGLPLIEQTWTLAGDIQWSVLVGLAGAAAAFVAAGRVVGRRGRLVAGLCACVPGLLGALVLALLVLTLFQLPVLRWAYDTPLPLVLALGLLLFPFALLLRLALRAGRPGEAVHAAALLRSSPSPAASARGREIEWELRSRGQFWVAFVLFCWGYLDLTASSILAPSGVTPVLVRLYNFMHYGQMAVLSAMVCVAFLVPFVLLLAAAVLRRAFRRAAARRPALAER